MKLQKSYNTYIFDYDGTVVDTMKMWRNICFQYLKHKGFDVEDGIDDELNRLSEMDRARKLIKDFNLNMTEREVIKDINEYVYLFYETFPMKEGMKELIIKLYNNGRRLILHSQTPETLLTKSLKANGIANYFDVIYSTTDLMLDKGDSSSFKYIIKTEKLKKKNTLVIEDSFRAYKGAIAAKLPTIMVRDYSNRNKIDKILNETKYLFETKELKEILS